MRLSDFSFDTDYTQRKNDAGELPFDGIPEQALRAQQSGCNVFNVYRNEVAELLPILPLGNNG